LAAAMKHFVKTPVFPPEKLSPLTARLIDSAKSLEGVDFRGSLRDRLPNTAAFTVAGCDSITLLAGLDMEGICASGGSACSAGSLQPSHVMLAMGVDKNSANSLVRFSLGRASTLAEVQSAETAFKNVINRARQH
jgi:cysteine desulfurase